MFCSRTLPRRNGSRKAAIATTAAGKVADTVIPVSPATMARQVATGLQFHPVTADALSHALTQLCDLFETPKLWSKAQRNAMAHPVGWEPSASAYAALYTELLEAAE